MTAVGAAEIGQPDLGQKAVGQDDKVVRAVQQMGGTPVGFDDTAFDTVIQHDPVADRVGPAEIERDARKDVAQGALHRQAEDDGKDTRRGDQRADGKAEDIGDHREDCAEIDQADDQILNEATFSRLAFEDQEDADEGDQCRAALIHQTTLARAMKTRSKVEAGAGPTS